MTLDQVQAELARIETRLASIDAGGGFAWLSFYSKRHAQAVRVSASFWKLEAKTINGSGETVEAAFAAMDAALDERDPKLMDATLGIGSAA